MPLVWSNWPSSPAAEPNLVMIVVAGAQVAQAFSVRNVGMLSWGTKPACVWPPHI
jgi:hypothetical protein